MNELLTLVVGRLDLFLLLLARWTGLFVTAPVFSNRMVPVPVRVLLAGALAFLIMPLFAGTPSLSFPAGLASGVVLELLTGMLIGFVATLIFTALQFAGEILDIDMGFAIVNVMDPASGMPMPLLGNLLQILALLFYLGLNGHHSLILAVLESYAAVPLAGLAAGNGLDRHLVDVAGEVFRAGFLLASPVLAALFLTTAALAVVGRAVPQMNLFVVGLPAKSGVGIILMALLLPLYTTAFAALFEELNRQVLATLPLMAP